MSFGNANNAEVVHLIFEHLHAKLQIYPSLTSGVNVIAGSVSWTLTSSGFTTVIASNTVSEDFDIHYIQVDSLSADNNLELVLYSGTAGAEVEIGRCALTRATVFADRPAAPFMCPIQTANSRISAKLAASAATSPATNINIKLFYHTY
jgi:hypothetical protein